MDRDLGVACARVLNGCLKVVCAYDVVEVFVLVGGVDANEVLVVSYFVHKNVVNKTAVFIQQPTVLDLPNFQLRRVVGANPIHQFESLRTANHQLAHVADVEYADARADGLVLVKNAFVLHRHIPAAKINHFGPKLAVHGIERSFQ